MLNNSSTIAAHPIFRIRVEQLGVDERVSLSYERAKLLMQIYDLSAADVQYCSERFWGLFTDPAGCLDTGMFTILAAHVGLAIGTLSRHLDARPDFRPLVDEFLRFDKVGIFLLTERGHGLDAFNIETTATRLKDRNYILHTPREEASKFMPASTPAFGISKVGLVMARVIENGQDLGCRYFIVPICNEKEMCPGVKSIRLPPRSGTAPLDFSITSFDHVWLPSTALVSSNPHEVTAPPDPLAAWWDENWRIQLGSLLLPAPLLHALKHSAYIVGRYSMIRCITDRREKRLPIFSFRTQQWPIMSATATSFVLENWYAGVIRESRDQTLQGHIRHAKAVIAKATMIRHVLKIMPTLSERCGAQGTFEHNFIARLENDAKGGVSAEGELLTLCIRLFSELLLKRYTIDMPPIEDSLLAKHAHDLMAENMRMLATIGDHRSDKFNSMLLPQSQPVIEAIGHALAYSEAKKAKLPQSILDAYECTVIREDPAWYSEHGLSRADQRLREEHTISSMLPDIKAYLSHLGVAQFVTAPIVSDEYWKEYLAGLPAYTGIMKSSLLGDDPIEVAKL